MRTITSRSIEYVIIACFISGIILVLAGCASPAAIAVLNKTQPITIGGKNTASISVGKLIVEIPSDKKIGTRQEGLAHIDKDTYYGSKILEGHSDYKTAINEELKTVGYSVFQPPNSLFGDDNQTPESVAFTIAGAVTDCSFDSYSSVTENHSNAIITIRWEMFDREKKTVVFKKISIGSGRGPSETISAIVADIRGSFRELLADQKFVDIIMQTKSTGNRGKIMSPFI